MVKPLRATLTLCLFICFHAVFATEKPVAKNGVLNLSDWDQYGYDAVRLRGDWEFYWDTLATPGDLDREFTSNPAYLPVPETWNYNSDSKGTPLKGLGYATYRLVVKLQDAPEKLGLKVQTTGTSARIFLNGILKSEIGRVATTRDAGLPDYDPQIIPFRNTSDEVEIIIQVSNYHYAKGGAWHDFELGREDDLRERHNQSVFFDFFLIGGLCILGFYHIGLFFMRRTEYKNLFMGVGSIIMGLRISATGEYIISQLDFIPWDGIMKLELGSFYLGVGILAAYLNQIFPEDFKKSYLRIIWTVSLAFTSLVLFFSPLTASYTVNIYQGFTLLCIVYFMVVIVKAAREKRESSGIFIIGFVVLCLFIINDILLSINQIYTTNLVGIGFFIFMLSQSYLLASRFNRTFSVNESLFAELESSNKQLEQRIEEKTKELRRTIRDLESTQEDLTQSNLSLQLTNRTKDKFFNIIGHDLKGPMSGVSIGLELTLHEWNKLTKAQLKDQIGIIQESAASGYNLIEQLFAWAKTQQGMMAFEPKAVDPESRVNAILGLLKPQADKKNIALNLSCEPGIVAFADINMLDAILRNLITNAIKFSNKGDSVDIGIQAQDDKIRISVQDHGVGIPEEKIDKLFEFEDQKSTFGTAGEKGTGLGLLLVKEFVDKHSGSIEVESSTGEGTLIVVYLPASVESPMR